MANIKTDSLNPILELELANGGRTTNFACPALVVGNEYILVFRHNDYTKAHRTVIGKAVKIDKDICIGNYHLVSPEKPDTKEDYCYIYKSNGTVVVKDTNEDVSDYVWLCKPITSSNTFVVDGLDKLFVKAPGGKVFQIVVSDEGALSTKEAI